MRKQVLFIAVFAILLTGCNAQEQQPTTEQPVVGDENVTPIVEDTGDNLAEYDFDSEDAKVDSIRKNENKVLADCDEITDEYLKSICVHDIYLKNALEQLDLTICEQIKFEDDKQRCIDQVERVIDSSN